MKYQYWACNQICGVEVSKGTWVRAEMRLTGSEDPTAGLPCYRNVCIIRKSAVQLNTRVYAVCICIQILV